MNSSTLTAIHQRVSDLEKEVKILKDINHDSTILATIKSEVPSSVKECLRIDLNDTLERVIKKQLAEFIQEHNVPAETVADVINKQLDSHKSVADIRKIKMEKAGKQTLFETMTKTKSFNKNTKHKALYHALMESILKDEDAMDKGVVAKSDDVDRDEGPPVGSNQGLKRKKTSKDAEDAQVLQNLGEYIRNTDEPPVANADPKDWFKKPERPPTPDPEWNKCKIVDNKPTQKWLSDLAKAEKPSKTFDDLMSTSIDLSALAMNRLQISDLIQDILVGPAYKFLKGTCKSYVKLEYNMEECYKALNDQLD
ncbi:hypothetical protein Tco_1391530 [Tanacetum coccineum]